LPIILDDYLCNNHAEIANCGGESMWLVIVIFALVTFLAWAGASMWQIIILIVLVIFVAWADYDIK
jgi:hypothetical protein